MLPQRITFQHPLSRANSFPHTLFQTLCRCRKTQPLCTQAIPNSFSKIPGVGYASYNGATPFRSCFCAGSVLSGVQRYIAIDLHVLCFQNVTKPFSRNSCRFTSIQNPRGWRRAHIPSSGHSTVDCPYSEGPSGRKYCVPFTGSCRRRSSCCKSSLRSTKSISEVLITSRSEAA